jgi:hypothetical protein
MAREVIGNMADKATESEENTEKETPSGEPQPEVKPDEETEPIVSEDEKTQETEPVEDALEEEKPSKATQEELDYVTREVQGLRAEKDIILKEIIDLRGDRRLVKQEQLEKVETEITDAESKLHPEDLAILKSPAFVKALRDQGFVSRQELQKDAQKQELDSFLEKYPEYKPENDPHDRNWNKLIEEYRRFNPVATRTEIRDNLERSRKLTSSTTPQSDRTALEAKRTQLRSGSVGGSGKTGSPKSSTQSVRSSNASDEDKIEALRRGGFSEDEIRETLEELNNQE